MNKEELAKLISDNAQNIAELLLVKPKAPENFTVDIEKLIKLLDVQVLLEDVNLYFNIHKPINNSIPYLFRVTNSLSEKAYKALKRAIANLIKDAIIQDYSPAGRVHGGLSFEDKEIEKDIIWRVTNYTGNDLPELHDLNINLIKIRNHFNPQLVLWGTGYMNKDLAAIMANPIAGEKTIYDSFKEMLKLNGVIQVIKGENS